MAIGVVGPIGMDRLNDFAISRAFYVLKEGRNTGSASCKICGMHLSKGEGRAARVCDAAAAGRSSSAYLCKRCSEIVETARTRIAEP